MTAVGLSGIPAHEMRATPPPPSDLRSSDSVAAGHDDVGPRLEQMNCLDEALHDVHHERAIGGDQFTRAREYRRRAEFLDRKRIPAIADLPGEAQVDRQRASVDFSGGKRGVDAIEFAQGHVCRGSASLLYRDLGGNACLPGLNEHPDLFAGQLR